MTRVLVVDDDETFRRAACLLLRRRGFRVVAEAGDGASAIAAASRVAPDAVLLDVQLPDTDGFTLARRLDGARVLLTSSDGALGTPGAVAASGAVGFVAKDRLAVADLRAYLVTPE